MVAEPLVAVMFASFGGAMTDHDVRMAAAALEMFAVALPGFVLVKVLQPGFFANQDTRTPFRYAAIAVVVNLLGSLATFSWMGHVGLALATALSAWTGTTSALRPCCEKALSSGTFAVALDSACRSLLGAIGSRPRFLCAVRRPVDTDVAIAAGWLARDDRSDWCAWLCRCAVFIWAASSNRAMRALLCRPRHNKQRDPTANAPILGLWK